MSSAWGCGPTAAPDLDPHAAERCMVSVYGIDQPGSSTRSPRRLPRPGPTSLTFLARGGNAAIYVLGSRWSSRRVDATPWRCACGRGERPPGRARGRPGRRRGALGPGARGPRCPCVRSWSIRTAGQVPRSRCVRSARRRIGLRLNSRRPHAPTRVRSALPPADRAMWRMIFVDCSGHKQVAEPRSRAS